MFSRKEPAFMASSHEQPPTLDTIAPRSLVADMEHALAFYGQLGFATTYHDEGFAIVERDGVALHFNAADDDEPPPHDHVLGWVSVTQIETLYQQYVPTGAIQSPLQMQPRGMHAFSLRDPNRNLLIFAERMPATSAQPMLMAISPRIPVGNLERGLAFYAQLGFTITDQDGEFTIVERDGVRLHVHVAEGHRVCWVGVTNCEALYQQYLPTGALRSSLQISSWGTKGFWLTDPFGTILLFDEALSTIPESDTESGS
jgi:hypothetical protein